MENEQIQTEEQIDYSSIDQQKDVETASRSLKAMSHPLRLMILCKLGEDEFSVQDIVDNVGTSQSNISQHLAILRDKGILSARKDANKVFYKVADFKTLKLIDMMREVFCSKHKLFLKGWTIQVTFYEPCVMSGTIAVSKMKRILSFVKTNIGKAPEPRNRSQVAKYLLQVAK